ncbi:MAG: DnaJ family molecular chaperone [Candidatus Kapaibacterium sp.]
MGQLLNRLRSFVRTSVSSSRNERESAWADRMLNSDDDELRRIIDELNADASTSSHHSQSRPSAERPRQGASSAPPPEVLKAHTTLNVPVSADAAAIKQAYRSSIAAWHPDRHASASPEQQATALRRAREINEAYLILKKYYSIT